jgi:hypothetical protein
MPEAATEAATEAVPRTWAPEAAQARVDELASEVRAACKRFTEDTGSVVAPIHIDVSRHYDAKLSFWSADRHTNVLTARQHP